jgi:DNA-directed RNA polymerase specialized sigma24 family protein
MPADQTAEAKGLAAFHILEKDDKHAIVAWAIGKLPEPLRNVLIMRRVDGLSDVEIGGVLGVHPNSVVLMEKQAAMLIRAIVAG